MLRRAFLKGGAAMPFGNQFSQGFQNPVFGAIQAGNTVINKQGIFQYSGKPALGNLIFSSVPNGVTQDKYGNKVLQGQTATYQYSVTTPTFALALTGASVVIYIWNGINWVLETWHNMTLLNSWANTGGFVNARYRFVASPMVTVEVEGVLTSSSATSAQFATLPPLYVPQNNVPVCAAGSNVNNGGLSPNVRCDTGGNLTMANTAALPVAGSYLFHGFIDTQV